MGLLRRAMSASSEEERQLAFHMLIARQAVERALDLCRQVQAQRRRTRSSSTSRTEDITRLLNSIHTEINSVRSLASSVNPVFAKTDPLLDASFALVRARALCMHLEAEERAVKSSERRRLDDVVGQLDRLERLLERVDGLSRQGALRESPISNQPAPQRQARNDANLARYKRFKHVVARRKVEAESGSEAAAREKVGLDREKSLRKLGLEVEDAT